MSLVKVCTATDVPIGGARRYVVGSLEICVVDLGDGEFRAIGDLCSHAKALLHEGEVDVDDETLACPRHGSTFDLNTGRPLSLPATAPVPHYDLKLENDDILIEVEE